MPKLVKSYYFDMDELHITDNSDQFGCAKRLINPDNVPSISVYNTRHSRKHGTVRGTMYPFYTSTEEERDEVVKLIRYYYYTPLNYSH